MSSNPLGVSHIDHVSILVTDIAATRAFYGGLLGLPEIAPPKSFDFVVLWYDLGNGQTLHLLHKPTPDTISPRHFCLHIANADAARAYLRSHGIAIEETVRIPTADRFFVRDPAGNRIELLQWEEPYDPTRDGRFSV